MGYVHGAAIDKPYIVERQYHNPADADEVLYSYAIEDGLGAEVTPADDDGDPDTQECLDAVDGDCHGVEWELWEPWPSLEKRPTGRVLTEGPSYWMGSLGEDGEDPTGLLYRRNRYYDPLAGQFTQEDPIGLAGGLNLYGYANSDPVNFSDPFGLAPCDDPRGCPDPDFELDGITVTVDRRIAGPIPRFEAANPCDRWLLSLMCLYHFGIETMRTIPRNMSAPMTEFVRNADWGAQRLQQSSKEVAKKVVKPTAELRFNQFPEPPRPSPRTDPLRNGFFKARTWITRLPAPATGILLLPRDEINCIMYNACVPGA